MRRRKLKTRFKLLFGMLAAVTAAICVLAYYDVKLRPVIRQVATSAAGDYATEIINDTVYDVLENDNVNYDDVVTLERDDSGAIAAITVNTVKVNKLRNEIALELSRRTNAVQNTRVDVPLGNFFSSGFLSGRGPTVTLNVLPTSSVHTELEQEFTAAGINQTIHKISFKAVVAFDLIFPTETVTETYTSRILVAQTVIVGKVPGTYAGFGQSSSAMRYIEDKTIQIG